ncbi:xaa-pro dipeptidase app [Eremomyces bilateralis CBS 781.70]|uniref:Xaa-Pro aminopeptidase n=1 Tax=Eremomyces bilateralis CBS 781.70 TaxID=1392243 RepID=A0A6G1G6F7_9PEZI|nr:xaa-pro dipeptidase app [Eremomyces bilateralis CBS 781.70]KAF1813419.1 xaa-pro dipeptidase app [Eremomyces bilateralis CBS 781.70]
MHRIRSYARTVCLPPVIRCGNAAIRRSAVNPLRRRPYSSYISAADLQFGQPLHETHPHLLQLGELTPGISALEYAQRRAKLAAILPKGAVAIIPSADVKYRSGAVFYEFHQDPDFYYLTGFNEPESLAIIEKTGDGAEHNFHLYVRPKDPRSELWEGARSGIEAAQDVFNADESGDIDGVGKFLPAMIKSATCVYTDLPKSIEPRTRFSKYLSGWKRNHGAVFDGALSQNASGVSPLRPHLSKLRVFKSEAEIELMRKVGKQSGRAITEAMRQSFSGEKSLWSFLEYQFQSNGLDGAAYVPVVAGGQNGLSIHYVRNDDVFSGDELVLVDAGGKYGNYITDITRTWPVNGKFSAAQRDLYEVVLRTQRTCVSLCRANAELSLDRLHRIAEESLMDGLQQLGFNLKGNAKETLFPHHLGHYIGLDVHDSPGYLRNAPLQPSQCVTIEPGIYVPDDERWPEAFRGIGIRIEDSICVQEEHPYVLTTEAVKEVVDIEALR